tara:strand:- start:38385 stop:40142 length:1758 start_codon:yes stop_codon:yes gene_type:complete
MKKVKIISTLLEKNDLKNSTNFFLSDSSTPLINYNKMNVLNNINLFNQNRNKLFKFNKKIINIIYKEYKKFYSSKISKKSFCLIISPFVFTFLDIIRSKYQSICECKKQIKAPLFSILDDKDFFYPNSFSEFLSKIQSDKFNLQLNTEIIMFKKFNHTIIKTDNDIKSQILDFFKKRKDKKNLKTIREIKNKKLNINNKTYFHKLDFRHNYALKKILKKNNKYKILENPKTYLEKLLKFEIDYELRKKILNKITHINPEEKFYVNVLIKYIPSLYLESIEENVKNLSNSLTEVPSSLVSNAHGWWGDDYFRYYLAVCINNKTKYVDVQHNGTYFIFDNNVHFDISSLFRSKFIGWGEACKKYIDCLQLPTLYTIQKKPKKKIDGKKIIFMSANVSRFFEGYRNSYLSGGHNLKYFFNQVLFFDNLNPDIMKNISIRARFNKKDPNNYASFVKKRFKKIKIENLKNTSFNRLNQSNVKIIIIDHCSTPWLEALFLNKPLIMFWNKDINKTSNKFSYIFKELKENQILFDTPHEAAIRLNNIANQNINWWYSKKIQNLRKKILNLFFSHDNRSINMWNNELRNIISN